jgi:hypothetical protein
LESGIAFPTRFAAHFLNLESDEKDLYRCSLVNHRWFSDCQAILYKDITIPDFSKENKLINTVISSKHESGKYVKQITLVKDLVAPAGISSLQYLDQLKIFYIS